MAADLLPRQGDIWRKFSFDTAGELSMATDFIRGEQQYRYDAEGRLTDSRERHQLSVAEDFAYDNADNLLNLRKLPFDTVDPLYDTPVANNRLTQWQHYRFEYDAWGNMTTRHSGGRMQHFAYDDDNRLLRAWGTGPLGEHDSHYRYDALGRRIHKSVTIKRGAEKTTRQTDFIWQGLRLLQEQHTDGNATYIYDPNESYTPLARVDQRHGETESQVYYFHTDINGTPLDVTDGEGKHRWSGKYHAWGKVTRQNVSDPRQSTVSRFAQPLRYPGQYSDDETGLHYNTFRYYDPEIGRFSTQDPIGLAGGINLYQYGPNPLTWIDPWGWAFGGVDFTGSPDLFPVKGSQLNIVEITMQGARGRDFTEAFKLAGISKADATGYTWHHLNDFDPVSGKTTMQLVTTSAHEATFPHAGSVSQFEKHFNLPSQSYGSADAVAISHSKGWLKGRIPKALRSGC